MFSKNKKIKGFTLVELMVVVAIIGILASVVLVGLNMAKDKGDIAARKQTVSSLQSAIVACCGQRGGSLVADPVANAGNEMCNPLTPIGVKYPTAEEMNSFAGFGGGTKVLRNCKDDSDADGVPDPALFYEFDDQIIDECASVTISPEKIEWAGSGC